MNSEQSNLLRLAKNCHTKQAWTQFASDYGEVIANTNDKKLVSEIFKQLKSDSSALNYGHEIFLFLLKGAHHADHLELAVEISDFSSKISNIDLYFEVIAIHLENSEPKSARKIASKALRLSNLSTKEELRLRMHVVSSYAEEGKYQKATAMFGPLEKLIYSEGISKEDKYNFISQIGRLHFFLGNYDDAIPFYKEASEYYLLNQNWEIAARTLFNVGACLGNSDNSNKDEAYYYIETCREVCEKNDLKGPLAHIESFYGLNAYQSGNFTEAKEYFFAALQHTQEEDAKFTRIHFLSMLALTCYSSGKFKLGKKYAMQTLRLAETDESDRYRTRYINLEAEMMWQDGDFEKSHELLKPVFSKLITNGIFTLEELATFNMYVSQEAALNSKEFSRSKIKVANPLKRNSFNWLETQYCLADLLLNSQKYADAEKKYKNIIEVSEQKDNRHHLALGLYGLIKVKFSTGKLDQEFKSLVTRFGIAVARMAHSPLKVDAHIIQAAIAYREGDLDECHRSLKAASKITAITAVNKVALNTWINTLEGKTTKFSSSMQASLLTRLTSIFFAPSIKAVGSHKFEVSGNYIVDLSKQQKLKDLLSYMLQRNVKSFRPEELQKEVWNQSTRLSGWQQKIRNTVQRLRVTFSPCLVPIIVHQNGMRFFSEAISVKSPSTSGSSKETKLSELLALKPCSSAEIAEHIGVSSATAKRTIKMLLEENKVVAVKNGRAIKYSLPDSNHI